MDKSDVVVVAAGVGSRMGAKVPKQYLKLGNSCILERTVNALLVSEAVRRVIVVIAKDDPYFSACTFQDPQRVITTLGGKERSDSVRAGLDKIETPWVMVHDAARPFVLAKDVNNLALNCMTQDCGGILVSKVVDTLKSVENLHIENTVDRTKLYRAQTPQMFKTKELKEALDKASKEGLQITDEASALELQGQKPLCVLASALNFKITEPEDLKLAQTIIDIQEGSNMRIGHGFDVHRFGGEGPCILGGVKVPYEQGLIAHSDGDVVIHAICDALLGALALGDIGKLYPDNDDAFLGIDSRKLLRDVKNRINNLGYQVVNLDVTILAQAPKIAPYSLQMRENIAQDLGISLNEVSIKATTTEKLGFTGRKEGIAVEAVTLLKRI